MNGLRSIIRRTLMTPSPYQVSNLPSEQNMNSFRTSCNSSFHLAFHIENSDTHPGHGYSVAPSRPPSRMNVSETLSDRKYEGGQDSAGAGMTTCSKLCENLLNSVYV